MRKRKPWWKSKKFWGVVITWVISAFGSKVGLDPETSITIASGVGAATGVEVINDVIGALRGEKSDPRLP